MSASSLSVPALLLLADGRFPMGGHVHSAGVEAAMADGRITSAADLEAFVVGRLWTTGLVEAALVAATIVHLEQPAAAVADVLRALDQEADARIPVAPLRAASRRQGRQLARVAGRCWPSPALIAAGGLHVDGGHLPVVSGTVASVIGATPTEGALVSLHHACTTPIQAALRMGGLDPYALAALSATMAADITAVASRAVAASTGPLRELPSRSSPALEIAAIAHAGVPARLFVT